MTSPTPNDLKEIITKKEETELLKSLEEGYIFLEAYLRASSGESTATDCCDKMLQKIKKYKELRKVLETP